MDIKHMSTVGTNFNDMESASLVFSLKTILDGIHFSRFEVWNNYLEVSEFKKNLFLKFGENCIVLHFCFSSH